MGFGSWGCLGTLIFEFGDVWIGFWKVLKWRNRGKMAGSRLVRDPVLGRRGPGSMKQVKIAKGVWGPQRLNSGAASLGVDA